MYVLEFGVVFNALTLDLLHVEKCVQHFVGWNVGMYTRLYVYIYIYTCTFAYMFGT